MYSKQEENLILYQKSKHKITIHLILYFFILCVYFLAMAYLFSSMEFLKVDDPAFRSMLIKLGIGQILLYGITFILLSTGKKWFRILYWIDIAISFLIIYLPIKLLLSNLTTILPFFVLVACMLLKTIVLCQIGGYLRNNRWCKIYFMMLISSMLMHLIHIMMVPMIMISVPMPWERFSMVRMPHRLPWYALPCSISCRIPTTLVSIASAVTTTISSVVR